ncbi:STAS domain-containing protein [Hymenobacter ruber]
MIDAALQEYSADKELAKCFMAKRYTLAGKDYVYIQPINYESEIDLERMIMPLDCILKLFTNNKVYNSIFSLSRVIGLMDIAFAIVIAHASDLNDRGGELILCDANEAIITTLDILGLRELLKYYSSEEEMLNRI